MISVSQCSIESEPAAGRRAAIVTGGTSGIGQATAIALASRGLDVVIVGRNALRMQHTLDAIRAGKPKSQVIGMCLDVCHEGDMQQMAARVLDRFGRIDMLVAAAGVGGPATALPQMVMQLTLDEWNDIVNTNLRGIFLCNRAVLPAMIRQRSGHIVNVSSSRGATTGLPFASAYCASKHAMIGLTESIAEEVAPHGVVVQSILPDGTDTPLVSHARHLCPDGLLSPAQVSDLILRMMQTTDTTWRYPILAPHQMSTDDGEPSP